LENVDEEEEKSNVVLYVFEKKKRSVAVHNTMLLG